MKLVKWLLIVVVALVVLVGAAIAVLPSIVPMERIVAEGAAEVEAATGRKLTVGGEPSLSLWPEVAIRLNQVAFANAEGAPDANMATVEAVRVAVPVLPLLSGEVEVKEFVLVKPDIRLYVDPQGKPNWQFGDADPASAGGGASGSSGGGAPEELSDIRLGDVRIEDGRISYVDAKGGTNEVLENVNVSIALPSLEGPFSLDGGLAWKGDDLTLKLDMAKPKAAMEGGKTQMKLAAAGSHIDLSFDGEADFSKGFALAGAAAVKTPSIKNLAAWAAAPIEMEGDVLGPFEAKGRLALSDGRIAFTGADLAIDAIRGKGDFALLTSGAVPAIQAKLALGELDLNPYMPASAEGGAAGGGGSGDAGWSTDPIDLSGLKAANADLDLSVEKLIVQEIKIGKSRVVAKLKGGVLDVNLSEMALYGGAGAGTVKVDASGATPKIANAFKLTGILAQPLLTDAAQFSELSGKGDLDIQATAAGGSEAELVKSVNGGGSFAFRDGSIEGFNLGAMVRKVETAFTSASAGEPQQTDFSALTGTFKITNGVVTNDDLLMLAPLFRVTGEGQTSLPARNVNYRVKPKAVASATGQGGDAGLAGIAVPVIIKGPWSNLSYAPDLSGVVEDIAKQPAKLLKGVAEGGDGAIKDVVKDPGGAIEDLTKQPGKALKGLFGK